MRLLKKLGFRDKNGSLNSSQKPVPSDNYKRREERKKKSFRILDFAIPEDHRLKIKDSDKMEIDMDLTRELKI